MSKRACHVLQEARHWLVAAFCARVPYSAAPLSRTRAPHLPIILSYSPRTTYSTFPTFPLTDDLKSQLQDSVSQLDKLVNQLNDAASLSSSRRQNLQRDVYRLQHTSSLLSEYDNLSCEIDEYMALAADDEDRDLQKSAQLEIAALEKQRDSVEQSLLLSLLPHDEVDDRDIMLEVRAAAGGQEATLFAEQLFGMYQAFAGEQGWKFEDVTSATNLVATISGQSVYQQLKYENGVHRIQRVPVTENKGRVHTSTASVVVMPQADVTAVDINQAHLKIETMRASGAGGQHVNTTDSAVRITHLPSGVVVSASNQRSQHQNKARAMQLLAARLEDAERQRHMASQKSERRALLGTGDRSERIRTYNYQENRITDHRIGYTVHGIEAMMAGSKLGDLVTRLREQDQTDLLMQVLQRP